MREHLVELYSQANRSFHLEDGREIVLIEHVYCMNLMSAVDVIPTLGLLLGCDACSELPRMTG